MKTRTYALWLAGVTIALSGLITIGCASSVTEDAGAAPDAETTDTDSIPTGADTDAPTVVSVAPQAGSDGIETSPAVIMTFGEAMNATILTQPQSGAFVLRGDRPPFSTDGAMIANDDNTVFTFSPFAPLAEGNRYTATLTTAVVDLAGNALAEEVAWSFTVGATPKRLATPFNVNDILRTTISPFGPIRHSRDSGLGHGGIDIPLPANAPFFAVANGSIVKVEEGSGGRGGKDVMLLIDLGGGTESGWYFEYEHVTLESGIGHGSELVKGQLFARNPGTAANNHLELGYWDGTFTHNKTCWVDFLEASAFQDEFINVIRVSTEFIENWTSVQEEGFYQVRGLLDTEAYPDGARLCYPLGTDVRIAVE